MNARPRVGFVVQRCGGDIAGGAEGLCLSSAQTMSADWDCEILTTCARDAKTWANAYPTGEASCDGVRTRRFAVDEPRDPRTFDRMSRHVARGAANIAEQETWMRAQGPYAPDLFAYLARAGSQYDRIFFFSYLYATTYFGLPLVAERAILVPLAHEEWMLDLQLFERIFARARACAFVSEEERLLVESRFRTIVASPTLVRVAIEAPTGDAVRFRASHRVTEPYALALGRVEAAKGSLELLAHFAAFKTADPRSFSLVLAGPSAIEPPRRSDVRVLGHISEADKWDALAGAEFAIVPSAYESLSIVALEAWAAARAVLANGSSAVLVGQCRRSGGGLWYSGEREFVALARSRLFGQAKALGAQGAHYVARTFDAAHARASLLDAYESSAAS